MKNQAAEVRNAFRESALQFIDVVERTPAEAWDAPGLGEWTLRELVAHVLGAFRGPDIAEPDGGEIAAESAAAYYVKAMDSPRIHEEVAERARRSVEAFGEDLAEAARTVVARCVGAVEGLDDNAAVATNIGAVRLIDYLPTRVLEVVVHTLDIADAAGVAFEPGHDGLRVSLALLGEIAVENGDGAALALGLSGRRALPGGYNVLA